jgi:hypothetical protein
MLAPYKEPNFRFVAEQLASDQAEAVRIEAALRTTFSLGFGVACEQIEDAIEVDGSSLDSAVTRGLYNAKWGQDEDVANLFHLGETLNG